LLFPWRFQHLDSTENWHFNVPSIEAHLHLHRTMIQTRFGDRKMQGYVRHRHYATTKRHYM